MLQGVPDSMIQRTNTMKLGDSILNIYYNVLRVKVN